MCGIFGSPNITPSVRRMLPYLAICMKERGSDAWGASDGTEVVKYLGPITDTWADAQPVIDQWQGGIFHTRAASHGTGKMVENAHPFIFPKNDGSGDIIGIHNGCLNNHEALNQKYNRTNAVDSMHLWQHRAEERPWDDIHGWGNIVWYETWPDGNRVISLCRFNSDNLIVCKLEQGELVFCSTYAPVATIARMVGNPVVSHYQIDEYRRYYFDQKADGTWAIFNTDDYYRFTRTTTVDTSNMYQGGRYVANRQGMTYTPARGYDTGENYCFKCNSVRISGKNQLMCFPCFNFAVREFNLFKEKQKEEAGPICDGGPECDCELLGMDGNVVHTCGMEYRA